VTIESDKSSTPQPERPSPDSNPSGPALTRRRAFLSALERKLPSRVRLQLIARQGLPEIRSMDKEENEKGHLPDGEHIEVHCLWVVECYPPSKVGGLIAGLRELGLDQARFGMEQGGAVEWVIKSRGSGFAGGWRNLGFFTRPRTPMFGADRVLTELPAFAEFASGSLYALSPSLTGLVVRFVLTDALGHEIDGALNRNYRTEIRSAGASAITYDGPDQQRRSSVDDCLRDARGQGAAWVRKHVPGFFAAETGGDHPTCTFLTTEILRPFAEEKPHDWGTYAGVLGLDRDHEAWDLQSYPGLSIHVPERDIADRHWLIAGRRGTFFNDDMQGAYGGPSGRGWSNRLQHGVDELVAVLGARTVLRDFHSATAAAPDAASVTANGSRRRRKLLELLPEAVSVLTEDIEPVAAELAIERDVKHLVRDLSAVVPGPENIYRLFKVPRAAGGQRQRSVLSRVRALVHRSRAGDQSRVAAQPPIPSLAEIVGEEIQVSADRLLRGATRTRNALATTAALSSALETLRLDRRLFRMSLILGVIAALAALPTLAVLFSLLLRAAGIDAPDLGPPPTPSPSA
jgi:hypothetical protein